MARPADTPRPAIELIAGRFAVDPTRPIPGAGGGLLAFAAIDHSEPRNGLMAVQAQANRPPRPVALAALAAVSIPGVLLPMAHGGGRGPDGVGHFVISQAPPGASVWTDLRPWSEGELVDRLLRPAALALDALQSIGQTHRAIRPDNVFRAGPGAACVLGAAWSAPPASLQPAIFEPPYSAMCLPHGRGDGSIADDVYSLGVLMLTLALGRMPMEGVGPVETVARKLELGSYAALVGGARVPPGIGDLLRGMLAADPEHRPPPLLLTDPAAARARRVAARPQRRAPAPLQVAGSPIWDSRSLGHAIALAPEAGLRMLRHGAVDQWLRRGLGDTALATRVDEFLRQRVGDATDDPVADATLATRVIATLDPLAPLCWRGIAVWPDGIGPALAEARAAAPADAALLAEIVATESVSPWAATRPERCNEARLRLQARQYRGLLMGRGPGDLDRLCYGLNPLLPCGSPLLRGGWVTDLSGLLRALEIVAGDRDRPTHGPLDADIHAYISARTEVSLGFSPINRKDGPAGISVQEQLRLLSRLQAIGQLPRLPALAGWLSDIASGDLGDWHGRGVRAEIETRLKQAAQTGQLAIVLAVLEDTAARAADTAGLRHAQLRLAQIDARLAAIGAGAGGAPDLGRRLGHDIATAAAIAAVAGVLVTAAIG